MRYLIIFIITIILSLFIIFYNPYSKYLGVYKNEINIEYNYKDEGYKWIYVSENNLFEIKQINDSKWKLIPKTNGNDTITFYYTNDDTKDNSIYEIFYKFTIKNNKIYWTEGEGKGLFEYPNPY